MTSPKLTNKNFVFFSIRNYSNPSCKDAKEFAEDLDRIKYLSKLFNKYLENGEIKERLVINHLIIFSNVFGAEASTRMLFFKMKSEHHKILKPFLVFLNLLPESLPEVDLISIPMDEVIIGKLRQI